MTDRCTGTTCSTPKSGTCPACGENGKGVDRLTPSHLLVPEKAASLSDSDYYFCPTPSCKVVYFSKDGAHYFSKQDVKTRVGLKETDDPVPVCYCFDYTRARIFEEIRRTGTSTATAYITEKIQAGECACESKNPSGRCCLGEVNKTVKAGLKIYGQTPIMKA